ncbi:hypothetical protein [Paraburkholderia phenazinium]|jgi:hypothetical protein|uniref:Uncharacterized protein n=1 Tax=Paraburkholderia phenazinium TaxID=60549 RepID=A0A1G8LKZ5_9BURK|nr:hypothetical protein [Paraburkholderia phenazinium]SDI56336.1 hypothetical protein SAMN05216466_12636 [Paraburkholderia phenazinium]
MNSNEQLRREFYTNSPSYCRVMGVVSAVTFGLYRVEGGGTVGLLSVRWENLGNEVVPQLHAYFDSWRVLASFSDVLARMSEVAGAPCSPEAFCQILLDCGFVHHAEPGSGEGILLSRQQDPVQGKGA